MKTLATLASFELRRGMRKKSFYALIALLVIPLLIAIYAHFQLTLVAKERLFTQAMIEKLRLDRLWAILLGLENLPPEVIAAAPYVTAIQAVSLASLAWLIAVMYGGDLLATDLRDKLVHLILIRPVSRTGYLASKIVSTLVLLAVLYGVAGVVAYASGYILVGVQRGLLEAVAYSTLIVIGVLPLLLASALIGAASRNPTIGFIGGIVVYFVSIIVGSLAALLIYGLPKSPTEMSEYMRTVMYASAANPFTAGAQIPKAIYAIIHKNAVLEVATTIGSTVKLNAWRLLTISFTSWTVAVAALLAGLWLLVARRDL